MINNKDIDSIVDLFISNIGLRRFNMLNVEYINSIIRMLNLSIRRTEKGEYEITDYTANITDKLKCTNDQYEYNFIRDNTNYHISINKDSIIITNDLNESITFGDKDFQYCVKKSNQSENKALITLANNQLSFYQSKEIPATKEEHYYISIKAFALGRNISLYKVSESIGLNGTLKKDTTITNDEGGYLRTETERFYNEEGKLINSSTNQEEIDSDYYDYVIEDFASHDFILILLDRLETIMPGITNKMITYNNNLGAVLEKTNTQNLSY